MPLAIKAVTEKQDLSAEEMSATMRLIMTGEASPAQVGGFLIGLRMKGETIDEIAAAAAVMRELASKVDVDKSILSILAAPAVMLQVVLIFRPPVLLWLQQPEAKLQNTVIDQLVVSRAVQTCWKLPG